jgi:hypothetical protein
LNLHVFWGWVVPYLLTTKIVTGTIFMNSHNAYLQVVGALKNIAYVSQNVTTPSALFTRAPPR